MFKNWNEHLAMVFAYSKVALCLVHFVRHSLASLAAFVLTLSLVSIASEFHGR